MSHNVSVVFGASCVGKTAFTVMFSASHFIQTYCETIENVYRKRISIDDTPVMLEIVDTCGADEFWPLKEQYLQSRNLVILMYSITDRKSFDQLGRYWELISLTNTTTKSFLVGNKTDSDSKREVAKEEGKEMADWMGVPFTECSSKDYECVASVFTELVSSSLQKADGPLLK